MTFGKPIFSESVTAMKRSRMYCCNITTSFSLIFSPMLSWCVPTIMTGELGARAYDEGKMLMWFGFRATKYQENLPEYCRAIAALRWVHFCLRQCATQPDTSSASTENIDASRNICGKWTKNWNLKEPRSFKNNNKNSLFLTPKIPRSEHNRPVHRIPILFLLFAHQIANVHPNRRDIVIFFLRIGRPGDRRAHSFRPMVVERFFILIWIDFAQQR